LTLSSTTWSVIRIVSPSVRTLKRGMMRNHECLVVFSSSKTRMLLVSCFDVWLELTRK